MKIGEPRKYDSVPARFEKTVTPLTRALAALQIGEMLPVQYDSEELRRLYGSVTGFAKNHGVRLITRKNGDTLEIYRLAKDDPNDQSPPASSK